MRTKDMRLRTSLALCLGVLAWHCATLVPAAAQAERAKCGVFFDKSAAGSVPPAMLAVVEAGHEVIAAQDCVATGNAAMACEHWRRALKALESADPALAADISASIRTLMQQHNCS